MNTETHLTKKYIKSLDLNHGGALRTVRFGCRIHKQTCERLLVSLMATLDLLRKETNSLSLISIFELKINDLREAIKLYEEKGFK